MNSSVLKGICKCGNAIAQSTSHCSECVEKTLRKLTIIDGPDTGKIFILNQSYQSIGSSSNCEISLPNDEHVSRKHCVIQFTADNFAYVVFLSANSNKIVVKDSGGGVNLENKLGIGGTLKIGSTLLKYAIE